MARGGSGGGDGPNGSPGTAEDGSMSEGFGMGVADTDQTPIGQEIEDQSFLDRVGVSIGDFFGNMFGTTKPGQTPDVQSGYKSAPVGVPNTDSPTQGLGMFGTIVMTALGIPVGLQIGINTLMGSTTAISDPLADAVGGALANLAGLPGIGGMMVGKAIGRKAKGLMAANPSAPVDTDVGGEFPSMMDSIAAQATPTYLPQRSAPTYLPQQAAQAYTALPATLSNQAQGLFQNRPTLKNPNTQLGMLTTQQNPYNQYT